MISISTIIRLRTAAEGASPINIHLLDKKSNVKTKGNHACLIWRSTFYSGHRIAILSTTNPFIIHTKEWEDNKGTWALQRSSLSIFIYNIHLSSCSMSFNVPLNITVRNDDYLPDSLRCVVEINTSPHHEDRGFILSIQTLLCNIFTCIITASSERLPIAKHLGVFHFNYPFVF